MSHRIQNSNLDETVKWSSIKTTIWFYYFSWLASLVSICNRFNLLSLYIYSFFFEDLHHDLCHTIYFMLKDTVKSSYFIIEFFIFIFQCLSGRIDKFCSLSFKKFTSICISCRDILIWMLYLRSLWYWCFR